MAEDGQASLRVPGNALPNPGRDQWNALLHTTSGGEEAGKRSCTRGLVEKEIHPRSLGCFSLRQNDAQKRQPSEPDALLWRTSQPITNVTLLLGVFLC